MNEWDVRVQIGLRIKELRAEACLSQDDLAYSIDMARSYLAEIETGKRNVSIQNLDRIAGGLGVTLDEFFDSGYFRRSED